MIKTKISKGFQTVVPSEIRRMVQGEPGDEIIWSVVGDEIFIRIVKLQPKDRLFKIVGKYATSHKDNATENIDKVVS